MPIDTYNNEDAVLQAVLASNFVIGVVPRPDALSDNTPWWVTVSDLTAKLGQDAPRILFRLPYAGMCQSPSNNDNAPNDDAYAFAPIPFEKTGLDVSVLVLKLDFTMGDVEHMGDVEQETGALLHTLSAHFDGDVQLVSISGCSGYAMVEIYDYIDTNDARLGGIDGVETATCIGGYADMSAINHALAEHSETQKSQNQH